MSLIKQTKFEEGEIFLKWLDSRLIRNNKNVIDIELGPTGSGKSYRHLRKGELWYKKHFNEPFPVENICFGALEVMKLLSSGKFRKGEIIIVEEAGVNLGSREWRSSVSRMFNHVLQSFRSMNLALFMNLPYLSMLDSQARLLAHSYSESVGINPETKQNKAKFFHIQVAQGTGKVYRHYPLIEVRGKALKVKRFTWNLPSEYLIEAYEKKKAAYLKKLTEDYSNKLDLAENGTQKLKMPAAVEFEAYNYHKKDMKVKDIAAILSIGEMTVYRYIKKIEEWGQFVEKMKEKRQEGRFLTLKTPLNTTPI